MDICKVCLENNSVTCSRINLNSKDCPEGNIQEIIEKHLCWWNLRQSIDINPYEPWICQQCWQELSSFHRFYQRIEKAHQQLSTLYVKVKEEQEFIDTSEIQLVKIMQEEYERDVIKKETESFTTHDLPETNIQMEEFMIVDIKAEPDTDLATESQAELMHPKDEVNSDEEHTKNDLGYSHRKYITTPYKRTKLEREDDEFIAANRKLYCNICNKIQSNFSELKSHVSQKHKQSGYVTCCGKKFQERFALVDHIHLHLNPDYFKCFQCGHKSLGRGYFEHHMREHQRQQRYVLVSCDLCGEMLPNKSSLKRHMIKMHTNKKPTNQHTCPICEITSDTFESHRSHLLYHNLEHACSMCNKAFKCPSQLRLHQLKHTVETPHACSYCPKKFKSSYSKNKHQKLKHGKEMEEERLKKETLWVLYQKGKRKIPDLDTGTLSNEVKINLSEDESN